MRDLVFYSPRTDLIWLVTNVDGGHLNLFTETSDGWADEELGLFYNILYIDKLILNGHLVLIGEL